VSEILSGHASYTNRLVGLAYLMHAHLGTSPARGLLRLHHLLRYLHIAIRSDTLFLKHLRIFIRRVEIAGGFQNRKSRAALATVPDYSGPIETIRADRRNLRPAWGERPNYSGQMDAKNAVPWWISLTDSH
jgi:hypothetical protein